MISFDLPKDLIAQEPAHPRDSARLLVYDRRTKSITDSIFSELESFLHPETTLVLNNSKVEHCRWLFDGGKTEIFVLEKLDQHTVRALVRPGKKFRIGSSVCLTDWLEAETTAIDEEGIRTLRLNITHDDARLTTIEHVPLPPYIRNSPAGEDTLAQEYQTVYAKPLGSKAAPTAGLHFTNALLSNIKQNHAIEEVTLHVGLGTFAGLTDENYKTGKLHEEWYEIDKAVAERIRQAKHVTAVGTTSVRTLESWSGSGDLMSNTSIFIQPGYSFKRVNSLITNFHLPGTSLLLLVEAFVGSDVELQRIYNHAIKQQYRFYSFGDAMLIV
ncbi:MAG TPA: tRNA preQ1(34) S-adenosylmethionine ribosyltransferase-isomerase QueA [Candidatus Saccharibacteria bacterium]|nr:tRNA preQ1(34) S-adenosylmethionine ribosyltransferase-isomerase QueA [Candidatus Saccharibacteria bacterium]